LLNKFQFVSHKFQINEQEAEWRSKKDNFWYEVDCAHTPMPTFTPTTYPPTHPSILIHPASHPSNGHQLPSTHPHIHPSTTAHTKQPTHTAHKSTSISLVPRLVGQSRFVGRPAASELKILCKPIFF
jgi:hypothetical protein